LIDMKPIDMGVSYFKRKRTAAASGALKLQCITVITFSSCTVLYFKLGIRSVERGICPIAMSTMNELFL